ncbi:phage scaffold protein [Pseudoalteromonas sp. JC28]|uniref:phage protease n=1 Tax=Pseudoalteromonas sp. JC28 TaxID=2267617 RepID=UPI00157490F2|nr:phage protease [Pseudoalteromonas sp. JC28]NSY36534.1 phage scaffold protein [Pseudoalteromonas sp. JC28]
MPNTTTQNIGLAICNLATLPNEQGVSERVLIIPDGEFQSADGRPFDVPSRKWLMDATAFDSLSLAATTRTKDFLFDYDHQTLHKEKNGQPAPASGWFKSDALEYVPGEGVYARSVEWTKNAYAALTAKEYRYVSPVFLYDKQTGRPLVLLHVALTNDPALTGLDEVAVLNSQYLLNNTGTNPMNEAQQLLAALGITVDGDVTSEHIEKGKAAITELKSKADGAEGKDKQIAALNTQIQQATSNTTVDLTKFVPVDVHNALRGELAALNSQHQGVTIETAIDKAKAEGRVIAAEIDYLKQLGEQSGLAALNAVLDSRQPIAALNAQQSKPTPTPTQDKTGVAALSVEDKYAADQLGISHKDYAALKEEDQ